MGKPPRIAKRRKTEGELLAMVDRRCSPPAWACFTHVPNATGGRHTRTADALAMSLWPSRGLEVHGFEVKTSRADWLRELKKPDKSIPIQKHCDRWWIVVGEKDMVDLEAGELPPTWGLLAPRGAKLFQVVEAPKLEPEPLDRLFVAALLRKAHAMVDSPAVVQRIRADLEVQYEEAAKSGEDHTTSLLRSENKSLTERLQAYEEAEKLAGFKIGHWRIREYGQLIGLLQQSGGLERLRRQLCVAEQNAQSVCDHAKAAREALDAAEKAHGPEA